jgi:hypothetical protein
MFKLDFWPAPSLYRTAIMGNDLRREKWKPLDLVVLLSKDETELRLKLVLERGEEMFLWYHVLFYARITILDWSVDY